MVHILHALIGLVAGSILGVAVVVGFITAAAQALQAESFDTVDENPAIH
jgi:hypothetical protein